MGGWKGYIIYTGFQLIVWIITIPRLKLFIPPLQEQGLIRKQQPCKTAKHLETCLCRQINSRVIFWQSRLQIYIFFFPQANCSLSTKPTLMPFYSLKDSAHDPPRTVNMYCACIHLCSVHNNHACNNLLTAQVVYFRLKSHRIDSGGTLSQPPLPTPLLKKPHRMSSAAFALRIVSL